ncbi:hypothetical protein Tco_0251349 [Tanacetum coccineum]
MKGRWVAQLICEGMREKVGEVMIDVMKAHDRIVGGSPAGIHVLFNGWYCGLASSKVTLGVSWLRLRGKPRTLVALRLLWSLLGNLS